MPLRRLSPAAAGLTLLVAAVFWHYARLPLYHTDLWGHLALGRWMAEHGRIPRSEPLMPLARETPLVDSAWLWQWLAFAIWRAAGPAGLQLAHGVTVAAACGLVLRAVALRTRSALAAAAALAVLLVIERFQFRIIRPQGAGCALYCGLLALLANHRPPRRAGWLVAALFALWANVHGSFVVGLLFLAGSAAGRAVDVALRTRCRGRPLREALAAAAGNRRTRRWGRWLLAGSAAALLNPWGARLYIESFTFARHPQLRDLIEWAPLRWNSWQGTACAVVGGLTLLLAGLNRRQVRAAAALPWGALALATARSARMIVWWGPLAACEVAGLVCTGLGKSRRTRAIGVARRGAQPAAIWTAVAVAGIGAAVVSSPFGMVLWSGHAPPLVESVSPQTPVAAVEWLHAHPQPGQVFHPYEWGDYLAWAGPPDAPVFVTSFAHLVPPRVWRDETAIRSGGADALPLLDRYQAATVLVDPARQRALATRLGKSAEWSEVYRDNVAAVYRRRQTAPGEKPPPSERD